MKVLQGRSFKTDGREAVHEATAGWDCSCPPDVVFLFTSTAQDPVEAAAATKELFGDALVVGCTSTGENLSGSHSNAALVMAALYTPRITWAGVCMNDLSSMTEETVGAATAQLFDALDVDQSEIEPHNFFCLNFVDGLRLKEEELCVHLTEALDGVSFVGGSAGDDLKFEETRIYFGGQAHTNAAVLVMGRADSEDAFDILKHQHFTQTARRMVITKCVPAERKVLEIDGYPAAEAYARAIGLPVDTPDAKERLADAAFLNPVLIAVYGELYVRSVQSVGDDGSLTFYCAIEEGMVMEVGDHHDMTEELQRDFSPKDQGKAAFMLTCNCILRALEAKSKDLHQDLDLVLQDASFASIGFDTYGEQLDGLHMNQTLVALALHD